MLTQLQAKVMDFRHYKRTIRDSVRPNAQLNWAILLVNHFTIILLKHCKVSLCQ